jgi:hypothetical protein
VGVSAATVVSAPPSGSNSSASNTSASENEAVSSVSAVSEQSQSTMEGNDHATSYANWSAADNFGIHVPVTEKKKEPFKNVVDVVKEGDVPELYVTFDDQIKNDTDLMKIKSIAVLDRNSFNIIEWSNNCTEDRKQSDWQGPKHGRVLKTRSMELFDLVLAVMNEETDEDLAVMELFDLVLAVMNESQLLTSNVLLSLKPKPAAGSKIDIEVFNKQLYALLCSLASLSGWDMDPASAYELAVKSSRRTFGVQSGAAGSIDKSYLESLHRGQEESNETLKMKILNHLI